MAERPSGELKSMGYEIFIGLLSILSIFNLVMSYIVQDPNLDMVLGVMNGVLSGIFMIDFIYRFSTASSRKDYFVRQNAQQELSGMGFEAYEPLTAAANSDDLEVATELRVVVLERVQAVRAARDHLLRADALQGLDVLLGEHLEQHLVAGAARRIAGAVLFLPEDGEVDARALQELRRRARDLLRAIVVRRRAADPVEDLRVGLLGLELAHERRDPVLDQVVAEEHDEAVIAQEAARGEEAKKFIQATIERETRIRNRNSKGTQKKCVICVARVIRITR